MVKTRKKTINRKTEAEAMISLITQSVGAQPGCNWVLK